MAEILHFEILRRHGQTHKHTHKHTNTQTHKQTDMGITIPRPPPMGGEVITSWSPVIDWDTASMRHFRQHIPRSSMTPGHTGSSQTTHPRSSMTPGYLRQHILGHPGSSQTTHPRSTMTTGHPGVLYIFDVNTLLPYHVISIHTGS